MPGYAPAMIQVKKRMFVPLIMTGARNVEHHYFWCSLEFVHSSSAFGFIVAKQRKNRK